MRHPRGVEAKGEGEAIVEAALHPTMRFDEPESAGQQARAVAFRTRGQHVQQRREAINALRSHLCECGHVAAVEIGYWPRLAKVVDDPDADVPELTREICRMLPVQIAQLANWPTGQPDQCAEGADRSDVERS